MKSALKDVILKGIRATRAATQKADSRFPESNYYAYFVREEFGSMIPMANAERVDASVYVLLNPFFIAVLVSQLEAGEMEADESLAWFILACMYAGETTDDGRAREHMVQLKGQLKKCPNTLNDQVIQVHFDRLR